MAHLALQAQKGEFTSLMIEDQLPMLALVYLLPTVLGVGLLAWRWFRGPEWMAYVEPLIFAVPILVGFCALEGRWPWAMHSPWRVHYWVAVGVAIMAGVAGVLSGKGRLARISGLVLVLLVCWAGLIVMLKDYSGKLHSDWTTTQHMGLFVFMLALAAGHVFGQIGLARVFPASWFLVSAGVILLGGTLYAFFGASSLKVAQWMTIGGEVAGVTAILSFTQKNKRVLPGVGAVFGFFVSASLLYGFYAAEKASLLPLVCVLAAPFAGLPWAMKSPRQSSIRLKMGCAIWILLLV
ncbi:MAG: hypothetical protein ACKVHP_20630, partial [Verrucomicrobiales bacterium]